MSEEVIELSVEETQALRAKLGLPPLRGVGEGSGSGASRAGDRDGGGTKDDKEIVLSVEETNALRAKIGLPPLKTTTDNKERGTSTSTAIHAPPKNLSAESEARKRIEDAAAKREASDRLRKLEEENLAHSGGGGESALDFAAKMMKSKGDVGGEDDEKKKSKKRKRKIAKNPQLSLGFDGEDEGEGERKESYTSSDLRGIKVSHATSDFAAGSTTILTLADKSILEVDPESNKVTGLMGGEGGDESQLVNVDMEGERNALENLKRKRKIELGAGRAGGYAGYDDDEFEELGGIGGASALGGGGPGGGVGAGSDTKSSSRGFAIGADGTVQASEEKKKSDIFTSFSGGAVSLQSRHASKVASDFMAHDEDDDMKEDREEKLRKERAKQAKLLEKMRKKDKKKAKKDRRGGKRRKAYDSDDDGGEEEGGFGLLASLEATAVVDSKEKKTRRRRGDGDDGEKMDVDEDGTREHDAVSTDATAPGDGGGDDDMAEKRRRFDRIMEKGKARTDRAFGNHPLLPASSSTKTSTNANDEDADDNDGEDDAFLNAALAKARRLKRLKEMSGAKLSGPSMSNKLGSGDATTAKEDAIVKAVERSRQEEEEKASRLKGSVNGDGSNEGITFEFDEMQEFTRALRAREDQAKRTAGSAMERGGRGVKITAARRKDDAASSLKSSIGGETASGHAQNGSESPGGDEVAEEDVDMKELAKTVQDDDSEEEGDVTGGFDATAESAPVGRGMSGFLSLLKQTGEIRKHATKEEMRGRAKDKRTYEDYEKLDLDKVVNIDKTGGGRNVHEKDLEFANREIKLEYRDDFGRLLTRKEAYRNMCYQFHGHGSSKKNQERRLKQIEREREEARLASQRSGGTLGALKATQKATGKAFIIHKT